MKIGLMPPVDYWVNALKRGAIPIEQFREVQEENPFWKTPDADLHVYPYTHAMPAMMSMGCHNKCAFCPTAAEHKGSRVEGDPRVIIPKYKDECVHFIDEDFFAHSEITNALLLLKENRVKWLAMSTYKNVQRMLDMYGAKFLYECGCRVLEIGLENICLYRKVGKKDLQTGPIEICYLNMTLLEGETKATIAENAEWMKTRSMNRPIHFNNGLWYSPGQFYYPYGAPADGAYTSGEVARTKPTFVPSSLLQEEFEIIDLAQANFYSKLVNGFKVYPKRPGYNIEEFIFNSEPEMKDWQKVMWLATSLRTQSVR